MTRNTIEIRQLTKRYGGLAAVDNVSLSLQRGSVVALLGPNGAGKSTLIDMLTGLSAPDTGSVEIFGLSPQAAIGEGAVSAMLQSSALLDDATVLDLVGMVAMLHAKPLSPAEALVRADIEDLRNRRAAALSGGQRQRVAYALAIVSDPDFLILDEPTSAMDVGTRRNFWQTMRAFTTAGNTVLFATHHLDEAQQYADRVIFLKGGQVFADGTVADVQALAQGREVRMTMPDASPEQVRDFPGVVELTEISPHADSGHYRVRLISADSDETLKYLLERFPQARDIEVEGLSLERAFLHLIEEPVHRTAERDS